MDVLTRIGLVELALGAVLGWAVAGGLILVALGLAVPGLPVWLAVTIVLGTWVNPTLFLPLAVDPRAAGRRWYQVVSVLSFTATSGGLVGAAVVGLVR